MKQKKRYCFVSDDDCHRYLIPSELADEFHRLLKVADFEDFSQNGIRKQKEFFQFVEENAQQVNIYEITFTDPR